MNADTRKIMAELEADMEKIRKQTVIHWHFCVGRRQVCVWIFRKWPFFHFGVSPCQK